MKRSLVLATFALILPSWAPAQPGKDKDKAAFRTAKVSRGSLQASIRALGSLQPEEVVDVGVQVPGMVVKFGPDPSDAKKFVDYGTPVEEGAILAQFDPTLYRLRVEQAKARLSRAESESRLADVQLRQSEIVVSRLEKIGLAVAATELTRARYDYELARVQGEVQRTAIKDAQFAVQEAEVLLGQTTIRAPIRGVVLYRHANVGQAVTPETAPLFRIARDLKRMEVWASVNEADIALVKPSQAVTFTVDPYPKEVFKGVVTQVRLNASKAQNDVVYTVVISVDNAAGKLLPGLTTDVRIAAAAKKNVLLVPNAALNWLPEAHQVTASARGMFYELEALRKDSRVKRVVWVEDKDYVRPVVIRAGLSDGVSTEMIDGDLADNPGAAGRGWELADEVGGARVHAGPHAQRNSSVHCTPGSLSCTIVRI